MKCIKTNKECECGTDTGPLCLIFGLKENDLNSFQFIERESYWKYVDYYGNIWKLNITHDRSFPFTMEIMEYK